MKKSIIVAIVLMLLIPVVSFAGFCGYLKADTTVTLKLGPFVDSTDGNTAETALTISQADVRLTKNGGNFAQKNDANAATHDELGYYNCQIDTTDTNTEGRLKVVVHESGALLVDQTYQVVNANVFDSLYAAATTDYLQVDTIQVTGTSQTANDNGADINAILTDTGTTLDGKIDTIDGIVDNILVDTAVIGALGAGLTNIPWNASWDAEAQSEAADALTAYDPPTKGELDSAFTEIKGGTWAAGTDTLEHIRNKQTDIETDTAVIGALGAGLTNIPWNASWDAEAQSEANDALVAIHLDHLLSVDYDPASKPGTATALLNELVENDAGISRFTENALEQAPSGTGASAATIADAVWDELQADHVGAGTFGLTASEIADILTDTAVIGALGAGLTNIPWNASWDAEAQSEAADALTAYDPPTKGELDSAFTEIKGGTWAAGTDTLEHIRNKQTDIETDTAVIGALGAGLTAIPWNSAWDAEVQSEAADALTAYDPPTKAEQDTAFTEIKGATWAAGTDTLEHIRNKQTDIETDTQDVQSRIPAALVSGRMSSDAVSISGSTDASDKLEASAETIVTAAAAAGTLSTTQMTTTLTEATDDHYNGRIIIWTSGVLKDQATDITDYDGATKMVTYTAVTEAPSDGDTFNII